MTSFEITRWLFIVTAIGGWSGLAYLLWRHYRRRRHTRKPRLTDPIFPKKRWWFFTF